MVLSMAVQVLHLPLDFEMRDDVRRLVIRLKETAGEFAKPLAATYFVRLWADWGRSGVEWRSLDLPFQGVEHPWEKEAIAHMIEEFCDWRGRTGELLKIFMETGLVQTFQRGDLYGLLLNSFWEFNAHLAPGFKTVQQKGGLAKAEKTRQYEAEKMAAQQQLVLEKQGALKLDEALKVSPEEEKRAIAFIMSMDRACGVRVRNSIQYSAPLLQLAVAIIRAYPREKIMLVERYLYKNERNPEVVKIPDLVIQKFDEVYRKSE